MKLLQKLSFFAALLLAAACTSENDLGGQTPDGGEKNDTNSQAVVLSINKPVHAAGTKAGSIATADENYISSLDVYVFASQSEAGPFTFQEMFYYREDAAETIAQPWAHSFTLTTSDADDKVSTGLLRLTKGLFVKLYCVANQTQLYTTDGGVTTVYDGFQALTQTAPGQANNVVTPGIPTVAEFEALHTPLIDPATLTDFLVTPLPMTGSYATPLDLTDFSVSARIQAGIKLNRMVARFDVINDLEESKFKVTGIALSKGRKGTTFFPVKPLGSDPAADGDLITYPYREVTAAQKGSENTADVVTTVMKGAFYSYPSLKEDMGGLLLKGIYYVNKTEEKEVTYPVSFEQVVNGVGSYIEIAANHRYTVTITKADENGLEVDLKVLEWNDEGEVDPYLPDNGFSEENVVLDAAGTTGAHVLEDGTISVLADNTSKFKFNIQSNAAISEDVDFGNGAAWFEIDAVRTKAGSIDSIFAYKVVADVASLKNLQPATIRLTNQASGKKKEITVIPTPGPVVSLSSTYTGYNKFEKDTAYIYNVNNASISLCVKSETLDGNTGFSVVPTGLTNMTFDPVAPYTADSVELKLVFVTKEATPITGSVQLTSTATGAVSTIGVKLKEASFVLNAGSFSNTGEAGNTLNLTGGTGSIPQITLLPVEGNNYTLNITSPEGVVPSITGGTDWLELDGEPQTIKGNGSVRTAFKVKTIAGVDFTGGKTDGKIKLTNNIAGGGDQEIEIVVTAPAPAPAP